MRLSPVKTAVIGAGHLGSLHARIYRELPQSELAGVYDSDPDRAAEIAGRHGVRVFPSLEAAVGAVEAVSLAVPTDMHYALGKAILQAGCHLLVEKPITTRQEEAAELVELAESRGLVLAVGHVERFNPALVAAAGQIHGALFVESERLAPFNPRGTEVPVVLDLMIHDIDIILSLIRRPVLEVQASGAAVFTGSVDIAKARLVFEGGAVANVSASRVSLKKVRKMRFFCPDRYVSVDMLKLTATSYRKRPGAEVPTGRSGVLPDMRKLIVREKIAVDKKREPLALELGDFLTCVRSGNRPVVSGRDGLTALAAADRIMQAIERASVIAGCESRED